MARGKIIAFRNILIDGYAAIDNTEVWETVQVRMPVLARGVGALLRCG